jgi:hypothetical protein
MHRWLSLIPFVFFAMIDGAIQVSSSSQPSSMTLCRQPSNSHHGHHSPISNPGNASFIAPPPPPPLGARFNTHSLQTSRADGTPNYFPVNTHSNASINHARTPSASSWIPPPPPPPIIKPGSISPSHQSTIPPPESALRLSLSGPGPPLSLNGYNAPQVSVQINRETHNTPQGSQAHHSPTKSTTVPIMHNHRNIPLNHTHAHVVHASNYNSPPTRTGSQFTPSHPFLNANVNRFHTSSAGSNNHGSDRAYPPSHHHRPSYPYPAHFSQGTVSSNMLLTHATTPFERGPFAASSIPPPHVLQTYGDPNKQSHARSPSSPSFSQSRSQPQQSTPPPPRPPKPPELELDHASNKDTPPPPDLPERLYGDAGGIHTRAREKLDLGILQSPTPIPTLSGATAASVNIGSLGLGREDVSASQGSTADGGDKVSGSFPALITQILIEDSDGRNDLANGNVRHFGERLACVMDMMHRC